MEKILCSSFELPNINIIGSNIQVLQIVFKYYESIVVNFNYISYASSTNLEETQYNKINNLISSSNEHKAKNQNYVRLKNKNNNIEYIGLSKLGKILKINPLIYNDLIIREDSILCFNESLNLLEDNETNQRIKEYINNKSIIDLTYIKRNFYLVKRKILKETEIDNLLVDLNSLLKDFLFLSSDKSLIEKRLGGNEQIIIMKSQLIAFEKSVTFSKIIKSEDNKSTYVNSEDDIICEGPGLIIFELNERKQNPIKIQRVIGLTLLLIILYIIEFLLSYSIN